MDKITAYKKEVLIEHFKELLQGMLEGEEELKTIGYFVDVDPYSKTALRGTIRLEIEINDVSDIF